VPALPQAAPAEPRHRVHHPCHDARTRALLAGPFPERRSRRPDGRRARRRARRRREALPGGDLRARGGRLHDGERDHGGRGRAPARPPAGSAVAERHRSLGHRSDRGRDGPERGPRAARGIGRALPGRGRLRRDPALRLGPLRVPQQGHRPPAGVPRRTERARGQARRALRAGARGKLGPAQRGARAPRSGLRGNRRSHRHLDPQPLRRGERPGSPALRAPPPGQRARQPHQGDPPGRALRSRPPRDGSHLLPLVLRTVGLHAPGEPRGGRPDGDERLRGVRPLGEVRRPRHALRPDGARARAPSLPRGRRRAGPCARGLPRSRGSRHTRDLPGDSPENRLERLLRELQNGLRRGARGRPGPGRRGRAPEAPRAAHDQGRAHTRADPAAHALRRDGAAPKSPRRPRASRAQLLVVLGCGGDGALQRAGSRALGDDASQPRGPAPADGSQGAREALEQRGLQGACRPTAGALASWPGIT